MSEQQKLFRKYKKLKTRQITREGTAWDIIMKSAT